jgi:CDP-glucose 4,6-dehydratase
VEGLEMNRDFWRDKKVFITGHTGFKGGWLALWLQDLGAKVHGYSLAPSTAPNFFSEARVGDGMASSTIADIRDAAALKEALQRSQADIVFHLAAQPLVRLSYAEPVETYAANVMGTVHLLEAVRATAPVRAVVIITTDKCYENREWVWGYRENDRLGGYDPYSSSKACAELISAAYRNSFFEKAGIALATVRAGNVIGGGDWAEDRLVPDMMRAVGNHKPVIIRNPKALRPWQFVLEPLFGYILLAEKLYNEGQAYAESWNFGPDEKDAKPVGWLVEQAGKIWGDAFQWEMDQRTQPHEAQILKLDCSKAKTRLQWQPRMPLLTALQWTITWYRHCRTTPSAMRQLSLEQIANYQQLLV